MSMPKCAPGKFGLCSCSPFLSHRTLALHHFATNRTTNLTEFRIELDLKDI